MIIFYLDLFLLNTGIENFESGALLVRHHQVLLLGWCFFFLWFFFYGFFFSWFSLFRFLLHRCIDLSLWCRCRFAWSFLKSWLDYFLLLLLSRWLGFFDFGGFGRFWFFIALIIFLDHIVNIFQILRLVFVFLFSSHIWLLFYFYYIIICVAD